MAVPGHSLPADYRGGSMHLAGWLYQTRECHPTDIPPTSGQPVIAPLETNTVDIPVPGGAVTAMGFLWKLWNRNDGMRGQAAPPIPVRAYPVWIIKCSSGRQIRVVSTDSL